MYICIGVYMNTHSKAVKCRKRDSLKPFSGKNALKTTFLKLFLATKKDFTLSFYLCIVKTRKVWVSGLNQHTANVPNRKVPKVRNRLKREQKPSLLGLCRVSGDSHRNPLASANLPYRITVVRQILDLQEVVRFHLGQHQ